MRILYSHRVSARDSQHAQVTALVSALRAAGPAVHVVGPGVGGGDANPALDLAWRQLPGAAAEWVEKLRDARAYRRLAQAAALIKPDLILERAGPFLTAGARLAQQSGRLLFLQVTEPPGGTQRTSPRAARHEIDMWRAAGRVLAASPRIADMVAAIGVPRDRISVVPPGAELTQVARRPDRGADDPVRILIWQQSLPEEALHKLIDMLAQPGLAHVRLSVVAATNEAAWYAAETGLAGCVQVVASPDYAAADIAVLPACETGTPSMLPDLMAAGCAIVAPDQPGLRDVLTHRDNAVLFDASSPHFMRNAVRWLAKEPEIRQQIGQRAQDWVADPARGWGGVASRIIDLAAADLFARRSGRGIAE